MITSSSSLVVHFPLRYFHCLLRRTLTKISSSRLRNPDRCYSRTPVILMNCESRSPRWPNPRFIHFLQRNRSRVKYIHSHHWRHTFWFAHPFTQLVCVCVAINEARSLLSKPKLTKFELTDDWSRCCRLAIDEGKEQSHSRQIKDKFRISQTQWNDFPEKRCHPQLKMNEHFSQWFVFASSFGFLHSQRLARVSAKQQRRRDSSNTAAATAMVEWWWWLAASI